MKNIFIIIILAIVFSGCDKLLEVTPESQITDQVYFESEGDFDPYVAGIYIYLRGSAKTGPQSITGIANNPQGNKIFVPNVFTPNGDGFNDVHYIYGNTIASVTIRYYNQFGQLIFETKDQRRGWDGTVGGRQQPVGVYIYVLQATLQDGSVVNMKGTITIVR